MNLMIITFAVLLINIPFGYWRGSVRKFSLQWFLAVHIPVPFIIVLRINGEIGFALYTYIFLVSAFFTGQQIGAYSYKNRSKLSTQLTAITVDNKEKIVGEIDEDV